MSERHNSQPRAPPYGCPADDTAPFPPTVRVVGPSDAGKTTLVADLVGRLSETHRVATVKSIHHDIEPDTPGTDTHRHREAGADTAVGVTPGYRFEVTPGGKSAGEGPQESRELAALARTLADLGSRDYEIAIVEGFGAAPLPAIRVGPPDEKPVTGEVIGTDEDDLDTLLERILSVEAPDPAALTAGSRVTGHDRTADNR